MVGTARCAVRIAERSVRRCSHERTKSIHQRHGFFRPIRGEDGAARHPYH